MLSAVILNINIPRVLILIAFMMRVITVIIFIHSVIMTMSTIKLSVIMMRVMITVVMVSVIMLGVIFLSIVILNVVIQNYTMLIAE